MPSRRILQAKRLLPRVREELAFHGIVVETDARHRVWRFIDRETRARLVTYIVSSGAVEGVGGGRSIQQAVQLARRSSPKLKPREL